MALFTTMFKIQALIKSIVRIVYLKTRPQALDNISLMKAKPLELYLPCPLVLKVAASFCGKIETISVRAVTLPPRPPD